jgi:hypothetical protein
LRSGPKAPHALPESAITPSAAFLNCLFMMLPRSP